MTGKLPQKITVPEDVHIEQIDEESVLLNMQTEEYFQLNETGTRMFDLIQQHDNPAEILEILTEEYDTEQSRLKKDLLQLIQELQKHGLVQTRNSSSSQNI